MGKSQIQYYDLCNRESLCVCFFFLPCLLLTAPQLSFGEPASFHCTQYFWALRSELTRLLEVWGLNKSYRNRKCFLLHPQWPQNHLGFCPIWDMVDQILFLLCGHPYPYNKLHFFLYLKEVGFSGLHLKNIYMYNNASHHNLVFWP